VSQALKRKPKQQSWEEVFRVYAQNVYVYEKIMKQRVTDDFPERKLHWFWELIKEDKEFKVS
jgi:hypothetical protein